MDPISQIYSALGESPIRKMVHGFYTRMRGDDLIGPMYPPDDWEGAEQRLANFLIFRFGGPQTYIQERGHPRLRARHFPFPIDSAARDRWLELMRQAMVEAEIPEPVASLIHDFFEQVAHSMQNREG